VEIKTNVINGMLQVQEYLYDEVNFLLRMELKDPRTYASILQAVASGCTKQSEISNRVGLDVTTVNKYLTVLHEM
jgi:AAA+ ATPase superfamily predicted ATPase